MKKIIISVLLVIFASASIASAATTWTNSTDGPAVEGDLPARADGATGWLGSTQFSVSTNVSLYADGDAGGYNCTAKHYSGDTQYISASTNAGIVEVNDLSKSVAVDDALATDANGATYSFN